MTRALGLNLGWRGRLVPPHLRRRLLALALVAAAALLLVSAKGQAEPARRVVVAARDLAAGTRLAAGDLRVVSLPAAGVPDGAAGAVDALVGRTVSGTVQAREALTPTRISAGPRTRSGLVGAPVRLVDPAVGALLRPGQLVDVLSAPAADGGTSVGVAQLVARAVRVLSVPARDTNGSEAGTLVVLEVSRSDATALATAEAAGRLSVTLLGE